MTSTDKLHEAIKRFQDAEQKLNDLPCAIDGTPEEADFHAAIAYVGSGDHVATSAVGALEALRLLRKEAREFAGSEMSRALIDGAMAYLDDIQRKSGDAFRRSMEMVGRFPSLLDVRGSSHFALLDALNGCIDLIGGVMERPQCGNERSLNVAGRYLESLQTFFMYELQRAMASAEEAPDDDDSDKEFRLRALLQHKASLAELSVKQLEEVVAWIDRHDAGRDAA